MPEASGALCNQIRQQGTVSPNRNQWHFLLCSDPFPHPPFFTRGTTQRFVLLPDNFKRLASNKFDMPYHKMSTCSKVMRAGRDIFEKKFWEKNLVKEKSTFRETEMS